MLVIRYIPTGRRNKRKFRIALQEKTQAPRAAAKEILGHYDPHLAERKDQIVLNEDRIKYWISQGAQPSVSVHNMLIEFGVIEGEKRRAVAPKPKPKAEGEEGEAAEGEVPAEGEAPAESASEEE